MAPLPGWGSFANRHLAAVIHHVKHAYPYWNRTQGRDHFFFPVIDRGACYLDGEALNSIKVSHPRFLGIAFQARATWNGHLLARCRVCARLAISALQLTHFGYTVTPGNPGPLKLGTKGKRIELAKYACA